MTRSKRSCPLGRPWLKASELHLMFPRYPSITSRRLRFSASRSSQGGWNSAPETTTLFIIPMLGISGTLESARRIEWDLPSKPSSTPIGLGLGWFEGHCMLHTPVCARPQLALDGLDQLNQPNTSMTTARWISCSCQNTMKRGYGPCEKQLVPTFTLTLS